MARVLRPGSGDLNNSTFVTSESGGCGRFASHDVDDKMMSCSVCFNNSYVMEVEEMLETKMK